MVGGSSESPSPSPLLYCSEGEIFFRFMMSIWSFIWIRTTRSLNSVTNGCWERERKNGQFVKLYSSRRICLLTLSSSSEVGLLVVSLVKHWSMKLTNRELHFLVCLRRGAGFRGIRNSARIGCMLHRAKRERERGGIHTVIEEGWMFLRGSPSAISMAVMPRDHWSLCMCVRVYA